MQFFGGGEELLQRSDVPQWNLIPDTYTLSDFSMAPSSGSIDDTNELNQDSGMIISSKIAHLWGNNAIGSGIKLPQSLYLTEGIYTLSFLCKHNDPNNNNAYPIGLYDDSAAESKLLGQCGVGKTFEKTSITFAVNESKNYGSLRIGTTSGAIYPAGSLYLGDFKLEHGSLATSWAPALQDFAMKADLLKYLLNGQSQTYVDDSFDLNSADIGTYRSWGKKPKNAPNDAEAWCLYMVGYFGDSAGNKYEIALDTDGNIYCRTLAGNPSKWNTWKGITTTDVK